MMVFVDLLSTSPKSSAFSFHFFRSLSAESLMGVRGFLISWAILFATSCYASARYAIMISVRLSKTTRVPIKLFSESWIVVIYTLKSNGLPFM